jgi:hypothetical protein
MSKENMKLIGRAYEAYSRGDVAMVTSSHRSWELDSGTRLMVSLRRQFHGEFRLRTVQTILGGFL